MIRLLFFLAVSFFFVEINAQEKTSNTKLKPKQHQRKHIVKPKQNQSKIKAKPRKTEGFTKLSPSKTKQT